MSAAHILRAVALAALLAIQARPAHADPVLFWSSGGPADPAGLVPITQGCCAGNDVIPSSQQPTLLERLRALLTRGGRA